MKESRDVKSFKLLRWLNMVVLSVILAGCADDPTALTFRENLECLYKPNVVLILFDDLNDWVFRPEDHPSVKVPNLDKLSERGISFTNVHAAVPVCGPSRICMMSGLYPQTIDNYNFAKYRNVEKLKNQNPLPLQFLKSGYDVFGTGKTLHEGEGGDFYTEYGQLPDYGPWPWQGKGDPKYTPHSNHYELWKRRIKDYSKHRDLDYAPLSEIPEWEEDKDNEIPGAVGWYSSGSTRQFKYIDDENRDKMPDEVYADFAIDVLKRDHEKPFFLTVGFIRPHTPLYVPEKYFNMFPIDSVQLPPYMKDDREDCAEPLRNRWLWGNIKFNTLINGEGEKAWKEWVQAYLASIAFIDEQVGKVMDALTSGPYADDTIVILASDNGYHVGEKDCIQKWHLWNESTRVPLYVILPNSKQDSVKCAKPTSLVDLYPTLVDLCELNDNIGDLSLDGKSLVPLMLDPSGKNWQYRPVLSAVKQTQSNNSKEIHFSIVDEEYRYTLCSNGEQELYNHCNDPNEWTNLTFDSSYSEIIDFMKKELGKIVGSNQELQEASTELN